ncbi:ribonuclease P protein component [Alienimonas californiensis]|uniref:Ribonuclease P protein component n=1 Tax=Alienimonas californiensis TaxID=2527989 RepID=A0A517P860_9PLAN|nr:ribonuclease P protein component [Alienimonas californiensis]QDT15535.1 Ribonuclease P protein component [Alienimonas californiensis]
MPTPADASPGSPSPIGGARPEQAAEPDERFPKHVRLRTTPQFSRVYDAKCRAGDGVLLVFGAPRPEDDPERLYQGRAISRVGLSVSKKNGNSVARHRVKRLLREAFRTSKADLPAGWDFVLIPRPKTGADLPRLRRSLVKLARRLPGQWASKQSRPGGGR